MKTILALCLLLSGCTHNSSINAVKNPVINTPEDVACHKLTLSLSANVAAVQAFARQQPGGKNTTLAIQKFQCSGFALVAEVYMGAMVDEAFREMIVVIGLHLLPDGSIEGGVLGSHGVEQ